MNRGIVVLLRHTLDPELAVLRLLRPATVEGDERPDRVAPLARGDVDADENARHHGQAELTSERAYTGSSARSSDSKLSRRSDSRR